GLTVEQPETNLIFFDTSDTRMTAAQFASRLRGAGVLVSTSGPYRGRACLHLDITASDIEEALAAMRRAASS
ncbi:MAG: low specificity L-threonine aldolase, partial [Acetobacteraceae bacterium]